MKIKPLQSKILKIVLKGIASAILLYFVSRKINARDIGIMLSKVHTIDLVLALSIFSLSAWVASIRSRIALLPVIPTLEKFYGHRIYLIGMFYNVFLPGGLGGDGYKIFALRKAFGTPTKMLFSALLLDRLSGLWAMLIIMICMFAFLPVNRYLSPVYLLPIIAVFSLGYLLLLRYLFPSFLDSLQRIHLMALGVQLLQVGTVIFLLRSQRAEIIYLPYLFSFSVASLATFIPISIGGVGIREYVMLHASAVFDMQTELAVFICSAFWMVSTCFSLVGALMFLHRGKPADREKSQEFNNQLVIEPID